ncbi:Carboxylic ester hydrolase [Mycena venus]|uniref:Carboxylic ester hydrolase n=1 Tax=Mycena venus TaxID=2733690 RepID=A0A8H6U3Q3_9AGAR|nr:Carboxylic ester hydrolase [Mycena venus]
MFLRPSNLVVLLCAFRCIEGTPVIDLGYAKYQGAVDTSTNLTTFLGIRYATAPIGVFSAEVRSINQTELQFICVISVSYPSDATGVKPAALLPVIFWIHGGGYLNGGSYQYRGTDIINQSNRGVVAVVIQYRLGVFGFLPGAAVKENGALNAGLRDQDFALRWVNQHISKFGGDPSRVTIWGESAGGGSVLQHIIANNGKTTPKLFRGAITSSLFLPSQYNYNDRIPEVSGSSFIAVLASWRSSYCSVKLWRRQSMRITISRYHGNSSLCPSCSAATDAMACLRSVDASILETANVAINAAGFYGTWLLVPVIDGEFITQRPSLSLAQGKINGDALLSVTNSFEGNRFVNQSTAATANATRYALDLWPNFGAEQAAKVGELYAGLGTQIFQTNAIYGESILICPTYYLLQAFAGRSFKGEFAIPPATHTADVLYYFPSISTDLPQVVFPPVFDNTTFRNAFAQSFTSFAISLDPNIKVDPTTITPKWSQWASRHTEMLFNKTESNTSVVRTEHTSSTLLERCQFWHSVSALTSQ